MNLYKLWQCEQNGYDTYDSAIVAAKNEDEAKRVSPDEYHVWNDALGCWAYRNRPHTADHRDDWANNLECIGVSLIGTAIKGTKAGLVSASFNAG